MPTLKQISCSIELGPSNVKLPEYGTIVRDGYIETFVAVPDAKLPFTVHIKTTGYIAPGLAIFVYMDGQYQCNRNRTNLKFPAEGLPKKDYEAEFRLRQKEEKTGDGRFFAREWSFARLDRVKADKAPNLRKSQYIENLGAIEIVILRCYADEVEPPRLLQDRTRDSKAAPPTTQKKEPATKATKAPSIPKPEPEPEPEPEFGGLIGLFDGANESKPGAVQNAEESEAEVQQSRTEQSGIDRSGDEQSGGSETIPAMHETTTRVVFADMPKSEHTTPQSQALMDLESIPREQLWDSAMNQCQPDAWRALVEVPQQLRWNPLTGEYDPSAWHAYELTRSGGPTKLVAGTRKLHNIGQIPADEFANENEFARRVCLTKTAEMLGVSKDILKAGSKREMGREALLARFRAMFMGRSPYEHDYGGVWALSKDIEVYCEQYKPFQQISPEKLGEKSSGLPQMHELERKLLFMAKNVDKHWFLKVHNRLNENPPSDKDMESLSQMQKMQHVIETGTFSEIKRIGYMPDAVSAEAPPNPTATERAAETKSSESSEDTTSVGPPSVASSLEVGLSGSSDDSDSDLLFMRNTFDGASDWDDTRGRSWHQKSVPNADGWEQLGAGTAQGPQPARYQYGQGIAQYDNSPQHVRFVGAMRNTPMIDAALSKKDGHYNERSVHGAERDRSPGSIWGLRNGPIRTAHEYDAFVKWKAKYYNRGTDARGMDCTVEEMQREQQQSKNGRRDSAKHNSRRQPDEKPRERTLEEDYAAGIRNRGFAEMCAEDDRQEALKASKKKSQSKSSHSHGWGAGDGDANNWNNNSPAQAGWGNTPANAEEAAVDDACWGDMTPASNRQQPSGNWADPQKTYDRRNDWGNTNNKAAAWDDTAKFSKRSRANDIHNKPLEKWTPDGGNQKNNNSWTPDGGNQTNKNNNWKPDGGYQNNNGNRSNASWGKGEGNQGHNDWNNDQRGGWGNSKAQSVRSNNNQSKKSGSNGWGQNDGNKNNVNDANWNNGANNNAGDWGNGGNGGNWGAQGNDGGWGDQGNDNQWGDQNQNNNAGGWGAASQGRSKTASGAPTNASRPKSNTASVAYSNVPPEARTRRGIENINSKDHIKSYWKGWNQAPGDDDSVAFKKYDMRRDAYKYPAEPRPSVPSNEAKDRSYGVQAGKGADYSHKCRRPEYLDSMEEPYAVFTFKYRSKRVVEGILDVKVDEVDSKKIEEEIEMQKMMGMSKAELAKEVAKMRLGGRGKGKRSETGSVAKSVKNDWGNGGGEVAAADAWGGDQGASPAGNNGW